MAYAEVRSIWPTFIGDAGKPRLFAVVFAGEPVPDYGTAQNLLSSRVFLSRPLATAYAARLNVVRDDDWIAR